MSNTFLVALIVSGLALVYWRLTLLVLGAIMIALLVTGIGMISGAVTDHGDRSVVDVLDEPRPDLPSVTPAPPSPGPPEQIPPEVPPASR